MAASEKLLPQPMQQSQPSGPKGIELVRTINDFRRNGLSALERLTERHGEIVYTRLFGHRVFLLSHPDFIYHVLLKSRENYLKVDSGKNAKKFFGNAMQLNNGEYALTMRRMLVPIFQPERLAKSYSDVIVSTTNAAADSWRPGWHTAVTEHLMDLVLDIAVQIHFGTEPGEDTKRMGRLFLAAISSLRNFMLPHWLPSPGNRRYHQSVAELNEEVFRRIQNCRNDCTDRTDLLSMFARLKSNDTELMTDIQIRDELISMMSAGYQTMAIALNQSLRLVAENPSVDETISQELRLLLAGRLPSAQDVSKMEYVEKVIKEVLRFCPPAGVIVRRALNEDWIDRWRIPAGSRVFISSWVVQRNPGFFNEPLTFKPERWNPQFERSVPLCAYMPFGRGARTCIAASLSSLILQLSLATILQRYRFQALRTISPSQSSWPIILKAGGLQLTVHDR